MFEVLPTIDDHDLTPVEKWAGVVNHKTEWVYQGPNWSLHKFCSAKEFTRIILGDPTEFSILVSDQVGSLSLFYQILFVLLQINMSPSFSPKSLSHIEHCILTMFAVKKLIISSHMIDLEQFELCLHQKSDSVSKWYCSYVHNINEKEILLTFQVNEGSIYFKIHLF